MMLMIATNKPTDIDREVDLGYQVIAEHMSKLLGSHLIASDHKNTRRCFVQSMHDANQSLAS